MCTFWVGPQLPSLEKPLQMCQEVCFPGDPAIVINHYNIHVRSVKELPQNLEEHILVTRGPPIRPSLPEVPENLRTHHFGD